MVNPLDSETLQAKTAERLARDVYLNADQLESQQQMHLFKVREDSELLQALANTRDQGRVPLIVRTPRCQLERSEIYEKIRNLLAIDEDAT
jgi:hypothetical protein